MVLSVVPCTDNISSKNSSSAYIWMKLCLRFDANFTTLVFCLHCLWETLQSKIHKQVMSATFLFQKHDCLSRTLTSRPTLTHLPVMEWRLHCSVGQRWLWFCNADSVLSESISSGKMNPVRNPDPQTILKSIKNSSRLKPSSTL